MIEPVSPERLVETYVERHPMDWSDQECLELLAEVQRLQGVERERDEARGQVERVRAVHDEIRDPAEGDEDWDRAPVGCIADSLDIALAVSDQLTTEGAGQ